jgi:hypothetical protein
MMMMMTRRRTRMVMTRRRRTMMVMMMMMICRGGLWTALRNAPGSFALFGGSTFNIDDHDGDDGEDEE